MAHPKWLRANYKNYCFLLKKFSVPLDEGAVACLKAMDWTFSHLSHKTQLEAHLRKLLEGSTC